MNDKSKVYLITGNFFEERHWANKTDFSYISIGSVWNPIFNGEIWLDDRTGKFIGRMQDIQGASSISEFEISPTTLKFTKTYDNGGSPIHYRFTKRGKYWVGDFITTKGNRGESKCIVSAVPLKFFTPSWKVIKKPKSNQHLKETAHKEFDF